MDKENRFKGMTQYLVLLNGEKLVSEYLKWIIISDTAKEYWLEKFKIDEKNHS